MHFGSLLKATLKKMKIPATHFADDLGFNRVAVYSVFNGKKIPSEETFERILNTYKFSPVQKDDLTRAFRLASFSKEKLETMEFIRNEIRFIGKSPVCELPELNELDLTESSVVLSRKTDFYNALITLLNIENKGENGVVYTNYSFFDEPTDKIVYDFASCKSCRLSVRHTIVKGDENSLKERLRNGFASIKFAKLGHFIDIAEPDEATFAFPCHFIGENATIMYDPQNENGFFTTKTSVTKAYFISAAKRDSKRPVFNRIIENPFELKSITEPLMMSTHMLFESHMPLCFFTEKDILDDTLRQEIPNREIILSAFWSHLLVCRGLNAIRVFTKSSIRAFAETGKSYEAPSIFLKNISPENRKRIFLETKDYILNGECPVLVAEDSNLSIDEVIEVFTFDRCTMVVFIVDKPGCDYVGSGFFTVNDSSFLPLLSDFYDYLIVNDYLLSRDESLKAIDEGIAVCDEIIEKEKEQQ